MKNRLFNFTSQLIARNKACNAKKLFFFNFKNLVMFLFYNISTLNHRRISCLLEMQNICQLSSACCKKEDICGLDLTHSHAVILPLATGRSQTLPDPIGIFLRFLYSKKYYVFENKLFFSLCTYSPFQPQSFFSLKNKCLRIMFHK